MDLYKWLINDMIPFFADLHDFLMNEIFTIGDISVNLLGVFSVGIISIIITAKIVALIIPN